MKKIVILVSSKNMPFDNQSIRLSRLELKNPFELVISQTPLQE